MFGPPPERMDSLAAMRATFAQMPSLDDEQRGGRKGSSAAASEAEGGNSSLIGSSFVLRPHLPPHVPGESGAYGGSIASTPTLTSLNNVALGSSTGLPPTFHTVDGGMTPTPVSDFFNTHLSHLVRHTREGCVYACAGKGRGREGRGSGGSPGWHAKELQGTQSHMNSEEDFDAWF